MSGEDGGPSKVRVEIFGEEYVIRTDMDEEYTRECARYVDEAIQDAHLGLHVSEPHRAAILAALQITDRFFRARRAREEQSRRLAARVAELRSRLADALEAAGAGDGAPAEAEPAAASEGSSRPASAERAGGEESHHGAPEAG